MKSQRSLIAVVLFVTAVSVVLLRFADRLEQAKKQKPSEKRYSFSEIADLEKSEKPVAEVKPSAPQPVSAPPEPELDNKTGLFWIDYHFDSPMRSASDLAKFISEDDVCSIHNHRFERTDVINELLKAPDLIREDDEQDQILKELFGDAGLLNPKTAEGEKRPSYLISEFFNALLYAKMLRGLEANVSDIDLAYRILDNLNRIDPENSAYTYFQAAILEKKGASISEIKAKLLETFSKPEFDTFDMQLSRRLREKAYGSPAYYVVAKSTYIPIPDALPTSFLIGKIIDQKDDPEFAKAAARYFEMRVPKKTPSGGSYAWILWDMMSYKISEGKLKLIKKRYPELEVAKLKPSYEIVNNWDTPQSRLYNGSWEKMTQKDGSGVKCERELLDQSIPKEKELFLKSISEVQ